jgi:hypothetical protein
MDYLDSQSYTKKLREKYLGERKKDCACLDIHRDTYFALRNPGVYDFGTEIPETCECPCHDQYDDQERDCVETPP